MTIGQIAKTVGVPQSAIRYYEAVGILPPPPRKNGARCYDPEAIDRLKILRFYRASGVSIRTLAAIATSERDAARNVRRAAVQRRIADLEACIADAQRAKSRLEQFLACRCNGIRSECVIFQ
jgi:MerR family copper efflux transcriptional regulator